MATMNIKPDLDRSTFPEDFEMSLKCEECDRTLDILWVSWPFKAELIAPWPPPEGKTPEPVQVAVAMSDELRKTVFDLGIPEPMPEPVVVSLWHERGDPDAPVDFDSPVYLPSRRPSIGRQTEVSDNGRGTMLWYRHPQNCGEQPSYFLSKADLVKACLKRHRLGFDRVRVGIGFDVEPV